VRARRARTGVCLSLLSTLLVAAACRDVAPVDRPALLELAADTIELPRNVALHEIRLRQRHGGTPIEPPRVDARVGDVLRFVATDALGYSIRFQHARLAPDALAFLDATNQLASPPLLSEGAAWVVSLDGAPAGEYPFLSANQGIEGVVVVQPR
jgi:hypothetical protein